MKKALKITAFLLAIALIAGIGLFANALVGNPVSKYLAERTVRTHLESTYPGTDYVIDSAGYNFKFGWYVVHIVSPGSPDTYFSVTTDMWGGIIRDNFDDVLSGWNTARRLDDEYRALTDTMFKAPTFPYVTDIAFGTLEIYPREALNSTDVPSYTLVQEELELDGVYDIRQLGREAGHLVIYVDETELTSHRAAEIMLDLRAIFDAAGIPFRAMDLHLRPVRNDDGTRTGKSFNVMHFLYDDITEENLSARLEAAAGEQKSEEKK